MDLRPSEIFYTQNSISNTFGKSTSHRYMYIGDTLDELINGSATVTSIPKIGVFRQEGKWFTVDNRRLWVFREAEKLGILTFVPVYETSIMDLNKFTTFNGGISVRVRGNVGGSAWRRRSTESRNPDQNNSSRALNQTNFPETTRYSSSNYYTHPAPTYQYSVPTRHSSFSLSDHSSSERSCFSDSGLHTYSRPSINTAGNDFDVFKENVYRTHRCLVTFICLIIFLVLFYKFYF